MKRYYAAYGSNLNIGQMKRRCPSAKIIGTSELPDYHLLFKGSRTGSYLTIEPEEGGSVPVAIWEVSEKDERALDRYEGFPSFYYKTEMQIGGKKVFLYIMHEDRPLGRPTWRYMMTCLEGYQDFGLDPEGLIKAYGRSEVMV